MEFAIVAYAGFSLNPPTRRCLFAISQTRNSGMDGGFEVLELGL